MVLGHLAYMEFISLWLLLSSFCIYKNHCIISDNLASATFSQFWLHHIRNGWHFKILTDLPPSLLSMPDFSDLMKHFLELGDDFPPQPIVIMQESNVPQWDPSLVFQAMSSSMNPEAAYINTSGRIEQQR